MTRVLTGPMAKRWAAVACSFAANEHATFLAPSVLTFDIPLVVAAVAVTLLSLGYDLTQPLLVGTVTALGGQRAGQAMRLNVFMLFTGFGPGSLLFGAALHVGFEAALALFSIVQLVAAMVAIPLFHSEVAQMHGQGLSNQHKGRGAYLILRADPGNSGDLVHANSYALLLCYDISLIVKIWKRNMPSKPWQR